MDTTENTNKAKADDQHILNRLKTIRVGKTKIINLLSMLKDKESHGETIDRGMIQSLVDSYDRLRQQEEEFIVILKNILKFEEKQDSEEQNIAVDLGDDDAYDNNELYETIKELGVASTDSELASSIHRSLNDNIRLTQEKLNAMKLLYEKNLSDRTKIANASIERRELTKLQLSQEHGELDRKQKLLERLRKKAAAKLLTTDTSAANKDTVAVTSPPADDSEEAKERVPPVPATVETVHLANSADSKTVTAVDEDFPDAELRANMSERFAAFEARKKRMRELRAQLNRIERSKMDSAYSDAIGRLQNLTEMRKHLESMTGVHSPTDDSQNLTTEKSPELLNDTVEGLKKDPPTLASPKSDSSDRSMATDERKNDSSAIAPIVVDEPSLSNIEVKNE